MSGAGLGWGPILRLGLVQAAMGAMVMPATALINRVMVVEHGLAAALPAGLVAWHYAVQLSRPAWGHGADRGGRRSPWIAGGLAALALGTVAAVDALAMIAAGGWAGYLLAVAAFTMIGAGVGAAGTSLLAILAAGVAPERRAAAAATCWCMMIAGIALSAGIAGAAIEPYSLGRLAIVVGVLVLAALALALVALRGVEDRVARREPVMTRDESFGEALAAVRGDAVARRFTLFVFLAMLAYSMQDLILEPFAGLRFAMSPGASTQLSGMQHGAALAGMLVAGFAGGGFAGRGDARWIAGGCIGSSLALAGLAIGAAGGDGWPLTANVLLLGFANGVFAVAAVARMLELAGEAGDGRAGLRMGVWGAAQAIAFALGGLGGAVAADLARAAMADGAAFALVFAGEAALFALAATMAATGGQSPRLRERTA